MNYLITDKFLVEIARKKQAKAAAKEQETGAPATRT